jgi:hypothetical protein
MKLLSTVITLISLAAAEKIAFAFELIRHGARAPLKDEYTEGFSVVTG